VLLISELTVIGFAFTLSVLWYYGTSHLSNLICTSLLWKNIHAENRTGHSNGFKFKHLCTASGRIYEAVEILKATFMVFLWFHFE